MPRSSAVVGAALLSAAVLLPGPAGRPTAEAVTVGVAGDVVAVAAGPGGGPRVTLRNDRSGTHKIAGSQNTADFYAYSPTFRGGVRVAFGDFDGDGRDELVTAAGPGGGPHIVIWQLTDTGALADADPGTPALDPADSFFAYDPRFGGGVNIAAGRVSGTNRDQLITGADAGGGAHVKVFDSGGTSARVSGRPTTAEFFAYPPGFVGGVRVAAGDLDGDGKDELVTGAGQGGGPHVEVFELSGASVAVADSFYAFAPTFSGGVQVASGDLDGLLTPERDELVVGAGPGGLPNVRVYGDSDADRAVSDQGPREQFSAFGPFAGGVRVAVAPKYTDPTGTAGNKHGYNRPDRYGTLVVGAGPGGGAQVNVYFDNQPDGTVSGPTDSVDALQFFGSFTGGVYVASGTPCPTCV